MLVGELSKCRCALIARGSIVYSWKRWVVAGSSGSPFCQDTEGEQFEKDWCKLTVRSDGVGG